MRRIGLEQLSLNALVLIRDNQQLELRHKKEEKKGNHDPICLSYLEFKDEWIIESEKSCLPKDVSWMDVLECFEEGERVARRSKRREISNVFC